MWQRRECSLEMFEQTSDVNALDDSVSDDGQEETYHLFTLGTHSMKSVSVQKGKKFSAAIKLSAAKFFFCLENFAIRYCINNQHTCNG